MQVAMLVCLAAWASACGSSPAYRYRAVAERYGLHRALHHAFLSDGESLEVVVSDPAGLPIRGLVMTIDTEDGPLRLVSDDKGRFAFPVSSRLLAANGTIEVKRPPGIEHFTMKIAFSMSHACNRGGRQGLAQLARDFERWPHRDFGPARIYAEEGVSPETIQQAGDHLAHARAIFEELTGAPPPPIGVVISKSVSSWNDSRDRDGRSIWRVDEAGVHDASGLIVIVHEWTHAMMSELLPGPNDDRSRYVEDGLCEALSHLTYERARATQGSPVAAGRAKELATFAKRRSFDLVLLALRFSSAEGNTIFDQLALACTDPVVTIGYGLGLAFWLEQLDQNPDVLRELFQKLRLAERPGDAELITLSEALSRPKGALHDMVVERALQTLRAHSPR